MGRLLAENVKRICREQGKQLKDLAGDMGIDPASLTRALNGNARLDTIEKIAGALGVSLKSLFEPMEETIETVWRDDVKPNPNKVYPLPSLNAVTHIKPTIKSPSIIVGDFTYFSDVDFESHVTHHYDFNGDRLIIGKFCQIAAGVTFVMNGANHQMNAATTFPFYIFEGWNQQAPPLSEMPIKGDTIIGNDVWIGQNATILAGVHIGDGAIIGMNSVVGSDVEPYTIVVGNPAKAIRKRFDDELIEMMLTLKWWDMSIEEINNLIPVLTCSNIDEVKEKIKTLIKME